MAGACRYILERPAKDLPDVRNRILQAATRLRGPIRQRELLDRSLPRAAQSSATLGRGHATGSHRRHLRHSPTYPFNLSSNTQRCMDLFCQKQEFSRSHPNQNHNPTRSRCVFLPCFSHNLEMFVPYHAFREIACRSASSPAPLSSSTFFPFFIMTKVGMDWTAYFCAVSLEQGQERKIIKIIRYMRWTQRNKGRYKVSFPQRQIPTFQQPCTLLVLSLH